MISVILPTTWQRSTFLPNVLRCFHNQSANDVELVIVDDGHTSIDYIFPNGHNYNYIKMSKETTLEQKMNIGVEAASSDILIKWDDDDWYHANFIDFMVEPLVQNGVQLACLAEHLVYFPKWKRLLRTGDDRCAGGTLTFTRKYWRRTPFRPLHKEIDSWFRRDGRMTKLRLREYPELYVMVRHNEGHTWTHKPNGEPIDNYFRMLEDHRRPLSEVVDSESLAFYRYLERRYSKKAEEHDIESDFFSDAR